jgi:hypothetical protein
MISPLIISILSYSTVQYLADKCTEIASASDYCNGDSDAKLPEQSCGVSKLTTWQYGTDRLGMFALSRSNENAEKRE